MKEWDQMMGEVRWPTVGIKSRQSAQGQLVRCRRAEVTEALAQLKNEDLQLLHWLLRYSFSRAQDLAQARSLRISTIYRHLAFQQEIGVVESITPAILGTNRCALYYLSNFRSTWWLPTCTAPRLR